MSGRPTISAYTPSNTDPKMLKRIFVQREKLLERIVDRLARSVASGDKHHILLVGPRGSGKTHLVSLAAWELQRREDLANEMRIAWLGEDDSFTGLVHLAFGIAAKLADEYPHEFPMEFKENVRGLSPDDAALAVLGSIVDQLQNRTLILITENMDRTFRGLGDSGQKKWRAFLQETRKIATLATSQQLFAGVSDRKEAFFGFFDIQHLQPLNVEEAQELIWRISKEQAKPELVAYLNSAEGRYRIRALHYLAGGNHRMYVLLSEFLTKDTLDDLVVAFENLAHDMTPYFQERMRSLPDQQRQLTQCLCDAEGAMTVKEIAEETFIDDRSCSKQLGNLKAKGYVRSEKRGKESYYDMSEPLMRLCLEVKNQRGRPLKMVARFLRAWFPATALQTVEADGNESLRVTEYCREAIRSNDYFHSAIAGKLDSEFRETIDKGQYTSARELAEELGFANQVSGLWAHAELAFCESDTTSEIDALTMLIKSKNMTSPHKTTPRILRGLAYCRSGKIELALADFAAVIDMPDAPANQKTYALINRGVLHGQQGAVELELMDYSAVINMPEATAERKAKALISRGIAHDQHGQPKLALADFSAVIDMSDAPTDQKAKAFFERGVTHVEEGKIELASSDFSAVIDMPDAPTEQKARALINRGISNLRKREFRSSQADFEAVLDLNEASMGLRTIALFTVAEGMVNHCDLPHVLAALQRAFEEGNRDSEYFGGKPEDLLWMALRLGPSEWAEYISELSPLYMKYDVAEKLGQGVTSSIAHLDQGGYSESQLDTWNAAWQEAGKDCEDLEIPLQCLAAAIEVMKSDPKTDRPLFKLPLEIRRLIRPLLTTSLGPVEGP
ncbi:Cdc6-related protein, AAA superfamily ATPase [Neorhodopirellula lusitana]|uniref:Cdc6-related protein, AAA superfamily ATPase n=1 Tax=Neorhodopirellula lusitana TaxID=445327 RepID=A0ABY1QI16_9BACT|nr:AAA family ATPase [Neorhodopirellula lusitana]SMP69736.1 Cdc6-related protein, AAA superfamily ATPase [Neorhodopirellula lusitana]